MRTLSTLVFGALLASFPGCTGEPPPGDPPPPSFAEYFAGELVLVEKARIQGDEEPVREARLDSLRRSHGLTRDQRDSLLAYCQASLPRWRAFLGDVLGRIEKRGNPVKSSGGGGPPKGMEGPAGGNTADTAAGRR